MKLLLDTHILIWYLQGSDRLSESIKQQLKDSETELWISPISVWEILMLEEKGKIQLDRKPNVWLKKYLRSLDIREAPLSFEIAIASREIELPHQDPADRFIAATAIVCDLTLATADRFLLACKRLSCLR